MPITVPVVDQSAMSAQPFASPGVVPVRNEAPQQQQALGQAMQQAGEFAFRTGQTIGDRFAEQLDEAKTKQAVNASLAATQKLLYDPQTGFLMKRNEDAVHALQPTQEALAKAWQAPEDGFTNDIQKMMYGQVKTAHLLDFGKVISEHGNQQLLAWSMGEAKSSAENYRLLALKSMASRFQVGEDGNSAGEFAKYTFLMDSEVRKAAAIAGLGQDNAQTEAMVREQRSKLNDSMIRQMLDAHDVAAADQWFNQESEKNNLQADAYDQLGSLIKSEKDRQAGEEGTQRYALLAASNGKPGWSPRLPLSDGSVRITDVPGSPRPGGRVHDGLDFAVPVGTQVLAPGDGKVTKVWNDDKFGGGLSVEMQFPNGYTAGVAHLSAANVQVGDTIQQGQQIALSGKSGNATGPTLHYMMMDADGNYIDPRNAGSPAPALSSMADPNVWQKAVQMAQDGPEAPQIKKRIIAGLNSLHDSQKSMEDQKYEQTKQAATDYKFAHGGYVPPSMLAGLRPEDVYKLQQPIPRETNEAVYEDYILHPPADPVQWLQQHRLDFAQGLHEELLQRAMNDANGPDKERAAQIDNDQMDDILNRNGFSNLVAPGKGTVDATNATALKVAIKDRFVSEQNATGKPLTRDRKAQIITDTIKDQVSQHRSLWFDSNNIPAFELEQGLPNAALAPNTYATVHTDQGPKKVKLANIPAADRVSISNQLRMRGLPVTQQAIAEAWYGAHKGKVPVF